MASLFRARRPRPPAEGEDEEEEVGGSGGKIVRARRRLEPPVSPYFRPPPSTPAPLLLPSTDSPTGSPRWLLGLISGAGKLISSVFRSDSSSSPSSSSSSSSSYGYSSDEDLGRRWDEEEGVDAPQGLLELDQGRKKLLLPSCVEESQAIVPISESKLAIEQLLLQETFSRDECSRLTKLIQSRVMDFPSLEHVQGRAESGVLKLGTGNTSSSSAALLPLNQKKEVIESVPHSPGNLGALFPSSPTTLSCAPYLHNAAVLEAKKWIEDRRLTLNSKCDSVCGPCVLNTDMLHYEFQDEGSPANLAKSYMRSLPPWQSPALLSNGLNTPPSSKVHLYEDDSTHSNPSHSLPSFKVFKRKYLSGKLIESPADTRRVRMRSADYLLLRPDLKEVDSSTRILENEALKISSPAVERERETLGANHDLHSSKDLETSSASAKLTAEFHVEDHCLNKILKFHDQNVIEVIPSAVTDKTTSISIASQPEEAMPSAELMGESELPTISRLESTHAKLEKEPLSSLGLDDKMDTIEPWQTKDQHDLIDSKPVVFASASGDHAGDMPLKGKVVRHDDTKLTNQSDADDVSNSSNNIQSSDVHTSSKVVGTLEVNNFIGPILESGIKQDEGKDEVDESRNIFHTNGSSADLNLNLDLESSGQDNLGCTYPSNGELLPGLCGGTSELVGEVGNQIATFQGVDSIAGKSQNGTRMRSIERMLTEPPPRPKRCQKKAVAKMRRGKGRGKAIGL